MAGAFTPTGGGRPFRDDAPKPFQRGTELKIKKCTDDNQGGANPNEQLKIFK